MSVFPLYNIRLLHRSCHILSLILFSMFISSKLVILKYPIFHHTLVTTKLEAFSQISMVSYPAMEKGINVRKTIVQYLSYSGKIYVKYHAASIDNCVAWLFSVFRGAFLSGKIHLVYQIFCVPLILTENLHKGEF